MTGTIRRLARRALVAAVLLLSAQGALRAQDTTRVDSTRARRDTTAKRPPAKPDSLKPDSLVVPIPGAPDSAQADSARRQFSVDSAARVAAAKKKAADTLRTPLAHAEVPTLVGLARKYRWDRDAMFATGALTLTDLLREVPGFTDMRAGWLLAPHMGSYFGDYKPIRVFYDGFELDALDRRNNGMVDLSFIPIWTLEEVAVEQGAQELRVYLRTWRVQRTTPNTRVDVGTGDLETNLYRGFFGQRYPNGTSLQVVAQQFSTTDPREAGDGDQLAVFARVGWAKKKWSADLTMNRIHRTRAEQARRDPLTGQLTDSLMKLPSLDASRNDWYARAGYGDPDKGPWLQLLAGQMRFRESPESTTTSLTGTNGGTTTGGTTTGGTTTDSVTGPRDTTTTRMQYVATGGLSRWGLRLSGAARLRSTSTDNFLSTSARAAFEKSRLAVSVFAEKRSEDSTSRLDAAVQFTPLRFLSLAGYASRVIPQKETLQPNQTAIRGEAGIRIGQLWFTGGAMIRDSALIRAPIVFDTSYKTIREERTVAAIAGVRGKLFKAIYLDVSAMRYGASGFFRPQTSIRSELYTSTGWLSKFPSGNFHIKFGVVSEIRDAAFFPVSYSTDSVFKAPLPTDTYKIWSTLLEIRLLDATLSWQYRNVVGFPYAQVPGLRMPRQVNFYGVRWDFFN